MDLNVWIGCLASYNAGHLHGAWFDLEDYKDKDAFVAAVRAMLARSPLARSPAMGGEHYIGDAEGFEPFGGLGGLGEYASLADVWAAAETLLGLDAEGLDMDVIRAAGEAFGARYVRDGIRADGPDWIRERYRGTYDSPGDYAEQLAEDCGEIPERWANYIDWEAVERDMELGGDVTIVGLDGYLYVFDNTI